MENIARAVSVHILEVFGALLFEWEKNDAYDEVYRIVKAGLELCGKETRQPSSN